MTAPRGKTFVDRGFAAIEALLVAVLAVMVAMVFGNVVLRYGFASGITMSEELSRILFVWLTFLGSVPVMRQHGHLGVEMLVGHLPTGGRRLCRIVCDILIVGCCVVFGWGAFEQVLLNRTNYAPVSGLATAWVYAAAAVSAVGIGLLALADLVQTLRSSELPETLTAHSYEP